MQDLATLHRSYDGAIPAELRALARAGSPLSLAIAQATASMHNRYNMTRTAIAGAKTARDSGDSERFARELEEVRRWRADHQRWNSHRWALLRSADRGNRSPQSGAAKAGA